MEVKSHAVRALIESVVGLSECTRELAVGVAGDERLLTALHRKLQAVNGAVAGLSQQQVMDEPRAPLPAADEPVAEAVQTQTVDSLDGAFDSLGFG